MVKHFRAKKQKVDVTFVATLCGHSAAVTCVKASSEFSIIVSGSQDGSVIVFDSNRLRIVRSLEGHFGPIVALDVHCFTVRALALSVDIPFTLQGDIVVLDDTGDGSGNLHLWSINGKHKASVRCNPKYVYAAFSCVNIVSL